jgi:hypothetical protein
MDAWGTLEMNRREGKQLQPSPRGREEATLFSENQFQIIL